MSGLGFFSVQERNEKFYKNFQMSRINNNNNKLIVVLKVTVTIILT